MKKFNLLIIAFFAVFSYSCDNFLDRPPLDAISTDSYWNSSSDLEKYVLQYYPLLPQHGNGMPFEDANSDNMIRLTPNNVMNGVRGIVAGNWISQWSNIRSINVFFDNYTKVKDGFETYRHVLGEAHFFKAWFYFDLLKRYGDLPWYNHALEPGSPELLNPRDPRTLIADSILAQLDKAIAYLNPRSSAGNFRLNKEAALAFKTRVALYEGTWQKYHAGTPFGTVGSQPEKYFQQCVDAAEELMQGDYTRGLYNTGNPESDYFTLFGMDNMSSVDEVLLYRVANSSESMGSGVQFYTTASTYGMGVTWSLVSSYLSKNGTPLDYLSFADENKGNDFLNVLKEQADNRLHATVWFPGDLRVAATAELFDKPWIDRGGNELCPTGFQVKKCANPYSSAAGLTDGGNNNSETGYIIFRYGEVLLNYAEASYELDKTIQYDALNLLRHRAGMPDFRSITQMDDPNRQDYGYAIDNALYEIRRERRVELALEGYRADDYMRWAAHTLFRGTRPLGYPFNAAEFPALPVPRLNQDGLIDYFRDQIPDGFGFREDQDYLNPIPQDELTNNPNLVQNPGW
ncbi:RagB/SusD family nutrient uptake outer membrane protein [Parapedobacter indicus]|uniref:Starch-binding associating with outer membrane n=1 Tax=Parapedobacter indicus TaxID=1477437 RepID=A0A1I3F2Q0_9SPHI|nr:RagB/SusD family nutrient uptake outer membrane protein [Parapedobacter indicus]PPL03534.1 putative outer membrane starch-binding protein [Parapedobacter indicus]SFI05443.1 Starch-binding associating with outer membrane [Parapedobacter indicus]